MKKIETQLIDQLQNGNHLDSKELDQAEEFINSLKREIDRRKITPKKILIKLEGGLVSAIYSEDEEITHATIIDVDDEAEDPIHIHQEQMIHGSISGAIERIKNKYTVAGKPASHG